MVVIFVLLVALVVGAVLIYGWLKLLTAIFDPLEKLKQKNSKDDNLYVVAHRQKMKNDDMYQEYLEWLDKNGGDIPLEKWKTAEERQFEKKFQDATFTRWRPGKQ